MILIVQRLLNEFKIPRNASEWQEMQLDLTAKKAALKEDERTDEVPVYVPENWKLFPAARFAI